MEQSTSWLKDLLLALSTGDDFGAAFILAAVGAAITGSEYYSLVFGGCVVGNAASADVLAGLQTLA